MSSHVGASEENRSRTGRAGMGLGAGRRGSGRRVRRPDVLRGCILLLEHIGEVIITGEIEMATTFVIAVCHGKEAIPCGPGIAEPSLMIGIMEKEREGLGIRPLL